MNLLKLTINIFIVSILVIIVLTAVLILYSGSSHFERITERYIEEKFSKMEGWSLSIGQLRFSPYRLKLILKDIKFSYSGENLSINDGHVEEARITLRLSTFFIPLKKKLSVREIFVKSPRAIISMKANDAGIVPGRKIRTPLKNLVWDIGRLSISSGSIFFREERIPLDLSLEGLIFEYHEKIFASKGSLSGILKGNIIVGLKDFSSSLTLDFRRNGNRIEISNFALADRWGNIKVQGVVDIGSDDSCDLQVTSLIEISSFFDLLPADSHPHGRIKVDGFLRGTLKRPLFQGKLFSQELSMYGARAEMASAEIFMSRDTVSIHPFTVSFIGGEIKAELKGSWKEDSNGFRFQGKARNLDIGRVEQIVKGQVIPVAGHASVEAVIDFRVSPLRVLSGKILVHLDQKKAGVRRDRFTPEGEIVASIQDGVIRIDACSLKTDSSSLQMDGIAYPLEQSDLRFLLESHEIAREIAIAARLPQSRKLTELARKNLVSLSGRASLKGSGKIGKTIGMQGTFDLSDLSIQSMNLGHISGFIRFDGRMFELKSVKLKGKEAKGYLNCSLDIPGLQNYHLEGELSDLPVDKVLRIAGKEKIKLHGTSRLQALIDADRGNIEGWIKVEILRGRLFKEEFENLHGEIHLEGHTARLKDFKIQSHGGTISASGDYQTVKRNLHLNFQGRELDSSRIELLKNDKAALNGKIEAGGEITLEYGKLRGVASFRSQELFINGIGTGPISLDCKMEHSHLSFSSNIGGWNARLIGVLFLERDFPFEGNAEFVKADYRIFEEISGFKRIIGASGFASVNLAFKGNLKNLGELRLEGEVKEFELNAGGNRYRNASSLPIMYSSGKISAESVDIIGENTDLSIDAHINIPANRMEIRLKGDFDLSIISAFTEEIVASGRGHLDAYSSGKFTSPDFKGTIRIDGGRIRHFALPYPMENLKLEAEFDRDFVTFHSIAFEFGGGEMRGSGIASLQKLGYDIYSFELEGKDVTLKFPEGLKYICDGSLLIRGDRKSAIISGDLNIIRGLYYKDFNLESQLLAFRAREYQPFEAVRMPQDVYLDINIRAEEGFWVKNDLATAELGGNLHIGGDLRRLELTGRLHALEGGRFEFRDVEYEIKEGYIDFADITRINPAFDILAETIVSDYRVNLRITGNLEKFQFNLSSVPSLPEQDIIALLMTGSTLESLTQEGSGAFTEDLATTYFAGKISDKLEKQIQKQLHLEKVMIDPMLIRSQADPTARLTVGKEISDNLMIIYSTYLGGSEENAYQLDYKIPRGFNLIAERTSTGAVGADLRYRKQFKFHDMEKSKNSPDRKERKIEEVQIDCDCPIKVKTLIRELPLRKGKEFRRKLVSEGAEKLKNSLVKKGYLESVIKHRIGKEKEGYKILYQIHCGKRTSIVLMGCSKLEKRKLKRKMEDIAIESLFPMEIMSDMENMLRNYYQNEGYFAIDVSSRKEEFNDGNELIFNIDRGEKVAIEKIIISGNKVFSEEKIRRQMLLREDSLFTKQLLQPSILKEDVLSIKNLYMENSYANVHIEEPFVSISADGRKATVLIRISEGGIVQISEIVFAGNSAVTVEELSRVAAIDAGTPLISGKILAAENMLRQKYDSNGFPDVKITTDVTLDGNSAKLLFKINEGKKRTIGDVIISGNHLTREKIIRNKLVFRRGDNLSREKFLQSQHELYKLGLFQNVIISYSPSGESGKDTVRVDVEEADNLHLTLGGGYDNLSGPRGHLELSDTNLFGYNRFTSSLVRLSQKESRVQILLKEPRLFSRNLDSILSSSWEEEEKESFTVRKIGTTLQVEKKIDPKWTRFIRHNFQNVDVYDLKISLEEFRDQEPKLNNLKLSSIGYSLIRDTRNDLFLPTKGTYASIDGRIFMKIIGSDIDFAKLFFNGSYFKDLGRNVVFASFIRAGLAKGIKDTDIIPLSERYFAGGDSSIRGFEMEEVSPKDPETGKPIGGEVIFIFNEELRFPIYGKIKGIIFYDAGNVYKQLKDTDLLDLRHVIGAGLRIETPIGPLRFEYGRKIDRKKEESGGEFFISIGQQF
ncbi:MAG: outer membrane protein assembly factor BamA [Acidobacteriota bacterium]